MIVVPSALSYMFANLIRSYALSQFPEWRAFAYQFESQANLLVNECFIEKPVDIHCRFSSLVLDAPAANLGKVYSETYQIDSVFRVEDLRKQSKIFHVKGGDIVLARTLKPTSLTVYYLYQKGLQEENINRALIPQNSNTVFFATRHTKLENLSFQVEDLKNGNSSLDFYGCDEIFIRKTLEEIGKIFTASAVQA